MIYEVINPHMPCTFKAPDLEVAALAMAALSDNRFGAEPENIAAEDLPPFPMGGAAVWWKEQFGTNPEPRMKARKQEVVEALESLMPGEIEDRSEIEAQVSQIESTEVKREKSLLFQGSPAPKLNVVSEGWKIADKIVAGKSE